MNDTFPAIAERAHARIGSTLNNKWRLDALLAIGGTAAIYRGTHRNGKQAAVKVIHRELTADGTLVARFLREGYLTNKVEHPRAVAVLDDDCTADGTFYLVMELLDGESLQKRIGRVGPLDIDETLEFGAQVLEVLVAAHAKGIIHRDVKPENVFVTDEGIKVLDFGIARSMEPLAGSPTATHFGIAMGTPAYMSPEQARGRWSEVDARSDLWSLGATLASCLLGTPLRKAETVSEELLLAMTDPPPAFAAICPRVPLEVAEILDRALAFDKSARWASAQAMLEAIRRLQNARLGRSRMEWLHGQSAAADSFRLPPQPEIPSSTALVSSFAEEESFSSLHPVSTSAPISPTLLSGESRADFAPLRLSRTREKPRALWVGAASLLALTVGGAAIAVGKPAFTVAGNAFGPPALAQSVTRDPHQRAPSSPPRPRELPGLPGPEDEATPKASAEEAKPNDKLEEAKTREEALRAAAPSVKPADSRRATPLPAIRKRAKPAPSGEPNAEENSREFVPDPSDPLDRHH